MLSKLLRVLALTPKPGLIAAILLLAACRTYTCDVPETCLSTPTALSSLSPTLVVESPSATSTVSTQELTATATPTGSATPFPTRPPAENLILCWGFECNYKLQQNDGDLKVPLGWMAFWGNVLRFGKLALKGQLASLRKDIEDKSLRIYELERQLTETKHEAEERGRQRDELKRDVEQLTSELSEMRTRFEKSLRADGSKPKRARKEKSNAVKTT